MGWDDPEGPHPWSPGPAAGDRPRQGQFCGSCQVGWGPGRPRGACRGRGACWQDAAGRWRVLGSGETPCHSWPHRRLPPVLRDPPRGRRGHGPGRQSLAGVGSGEETDLRSRWLLSVEAVEGVTGLGQGGCCVEGPVGAPPSPQRGSGLPAFLKEGSSARLLTIRWCPGGLRQAMTTIACLPEGTAPL